MDLAGRRAPRTAGPQVQRRVQSHAAAHLQRRAPDAARRQSGHRAPAAPEGQRVAHSADAQLSARTGRWLGKDHDPLCRRDGVEAAGPGAQAADRRAQPHARPVRLRVPRALSGRQHPRGHQGRLREGEAQDPDEPHRHRQLGCRHRHPLRLREDPGLARDAGGVLQGAVARTGAGHRTAAQGRRLAHRQGAGTGQEAAGNQAQGTRRQREEGRRPDVRGAGRGHDSRSTRRTASRTCSTSRR